MRLIATADLHYNHARSRAVAEEVIAQINAAGGDVLLVVGDTAAGDGDDLERCLSLFRFRGPKLFVAGNHELWTRAGDSLKLFETSLPARAAAAGWHWLEGRPFVCEDLAIMGSIGWYDYSFAVADLGIPQRYYQAKLSPGVAERLSEFAHLLAGDEPESSRQIIARWNDGRFVRLGMDDASFLNRRLGAIGRQLDALPERAKVVAAVHHVPFAELLPPRRGLQWDFARAYLGSRAMGDLLRADPRIEHVLCGHSHWPAEAQVGRIRAINIGSGYRQKRFVTLDLP